MERTKNSKHLRRVSEQACMRSAVCACAKEREGETDRKTEKQHGNLFLVYFLILKNAFISIKIY